MKCILLLLLSLLESLASAHGEKLVECEPPKWIFPAESTDGIFKGDLVLGCKILLPSKMKDLRLLHERMIEKISSKGIVHSGPIMTVLDALPALKWDVTRQIAEESNLLTIREDALLALKPEHHLIYKTYSTKISGTGASGYLRSVHFSTRVEKKSEGIVQIEFRNLVQVQRPWYALDLLFVPIARNICIQKLEKVKDEFLPSILETL